VRCDDQRLGERENGVLHVDCMSFVHLIIPQDERAWRVEGGW